MRTKRFLEKTDSKFTRGSTEYEFHVGTAGQRKNNVKKIIAVKDATSALAKKRPEKIHSCRGLNLKPLKKERNKKINKYQEDHPGKTDFFQAFFSQLHIYMLHIFTISRDY